MTFVRGVFRYVDLYDLDAKAIEIRFVDTDFSLVLVLPNVPMGFPEVEENMNDNELRKIIDHMRSERMFVKIPIFQIKYQISLKNISKRVSVKF